jgi:hypothetical protein
MKKKEQIQLCRLLFAKALKQKKPSKRLGKRLPEFKNNIER